jgi:hypothetical protein
MSSGNSPYREPPERLKKSGPPWLTWLTWKDVAVVDHLLVIGGGFLVLQAFMAGSVFLVAGLLLFAFSVVIIFIDAKERHRREDREDT